MTRWHRVKRLLGRGRRANRLAVPEPAAPAPADDANLLLISDLHLGEACKEHTRIEYLKRAETLDQHICAFLEHHRSHRLGDRPWRLVLGGDLLDFLQVTLFGPDADLEARRFGLGTDEASSRWKFQRLLERHRRVFVYLADFVGAGHRLEVVQGNHDAELFWPAVQAAFVDALVGLYFGVEHQPGADRAAFAARIRFNPWFFLEPGLLYFEHGHRFDDFCVTTPQLCPLRPQAEDELVQPLSGLAIRYFANLERGFRTHDKEHWGLPEYAAYYRSQGLGRVLEAGRSYISFLKRTLSYHLEHGRHTSQAALEAHRAALDTMASQGPLDRPTLEALDQLSAPSAMASPRQLYTMLGGAEWTGIGLTILVGLGALFVAPGVWSGLLTVAACSVAAVGWIRLWRGQVDVDVRGKLARKAQAIGRLLNVPVVAFGHAHAPRRARQPHKHTAFYVNTGCFLPPSTRHAPDAPCDCPCTFVVLPRPGAFERPTPTLHRWCCVQEAAAPF